MGHETIVMVDRQGGHCIGLCKANVDTDTMATIFSRLCLAPIRNAAAPGTEVKAELVVAPRINGRGAGQGDPFVVEPVSPESTVAAADGAVTGCDRCRYSIEAPADALAVTNTFDHGFPRSKWSNVVRRRSSARQLVQWGPAASATRVETNSSLRRLPKRSARSETALRC